MRIGASGAFVHASNRGHDSIGIFSVDRTAGMPAVCDWEPTQGQKPRFVTPDPGGRLFYAANEIGNSVVSFVVDEHAGKLTPTGRIVKTGALTCIVFS